eukprot:2559753-Pleurochrysis_carterae.AAC.1
MVSAWHLDKLVCSRRRGGDGREGGMTTRLCARLCSPAVACAGRSGCAGAGAAITADLGGGVRSKRWG